MKNYSFPGDSKVIFYLKKNIKKKEDFYEFVCFSNICKFCEMNTKSMFVYSLASMLYITWERFRWADEKISKKYYVQLIETHYFNGIKKKKRKVLLSISTV